MKERSFDGARVDKSCLSVIPGGILKQIGAEDNLCIEDLIPHSTQNLGKVTVRIRFPDARSVKLRKFTSAARLSRVTSTLDALRSVHFPEVLLCQGDWVCLEWTEGSLFPKDHFQKNDDSISPYLRAIARFQASVHRETSGIVGWTDRQETWADSIKELFYHRVLRLANSMVLTDQEVGKILGMLDKSDIETSAISITHGDLSLKNIVFKGECPVSVDNEHLMPHFADYDFWKAVYYLKLDREAAAKYLEEYSKVYDRDSIVKNKVFWQVYNLVLGIYLRKFVNLIDYGTQVAMLKQLLNSEL
jgi:hypothetical protein